MSRAELSDMLLLLGSLFLLAFIAAFSIDISEHRRKKLLIRDHEPEEIE